MSKFMAILGFYQVDKYGVISYEIYKKLFVLVLTVTITSYITINNGSNAKSGVLVGGIVGAILGLIWSVITLSIIVYAPL